MTPSEDPTGGRNQASALLRSLRAGADRAVSRTSDALSRRRATNPVVDTAVRIAERDRDAFASVLGSAVALRLFLFFVPAMLVVVGIVNVVGVPSIIPRILDASGTGGRVARDIQQASELSHRGGLALLMTGTVLMLWAGRSLTSVLAASSAGGWGLSARHARPTLKMAGTLSGLVFTMAILAGVMARFRQESGVVLTGGVMAVSFAVLAGAWWVVLWTLPKGTPDPGAQIPGAVFFGASLTVVQWLMQYYLPARLERSSTTMGTVGVAVASLSYFFVVGRLMASSFVVNAVMFERHGSISVRFFALPGLRRIADRSPRVRQFFQLPGTGTDAGPPIAADGGSAGPDPACGDRPQKGW